MSQYGINPLLVATQGLIAFVGLAPFPFSSIALAIQGLIAELKEEPRQVYGGGRLARSVHALPKLPPRSTPKPASGPPAPDRRGDAALTPEIIEAQWELLEAKRATESRTSEIRIDIAADASADQVRQQLLSAGLDDEDEITALVLILGLAA